MIIETLSALGAISAGASIGVYLVASETAMPSFRPSKQRAGRRRRSDASSVVIGGVPWRRAAADAALAVEAFCALCDGTIEGIETHNDAARLETGATLRCRPCGLKYPLTEGASWREVVATAEQRLGKDSARAVPAN